jgi:formate dehydrogenase iron-sulfur subunit
MIPACAKACPTESIQFGDLDQLREHAKERVELLHQRGAPEAYLYGASAEDQPGTEGLNAFFLLVDKPEVYNLPPDPVIPTKKVKDAWLSAGATAAGMALAAIGAVWFGARRS